MRVLDIGVVSYKNPDKLRATLASIEQQSTTDWRCLIFHNPAKGPEDSQAREVAREACSRNSRFSLFEMSENVGYVGGVNAFFDRAETEYLAYCDNDVELRTNGWDEALCAILDANPECGQVFPGSGHYGFFNGRYHECLWNAGYCWILRRQALDKLALVDGKYRRGNPPGCLDTSLGHHEEVDLMIRLRFAGYQIGCRPDVKVLHHETATQSDSAVHRPGGRIHDGVVRWMNKWNGYFCGDQLEYSMTAYDSRALRYTDWNVCALYLERMTLHYFPQWNSTPRTVMVPGVGDMDVVEVLKPKDCYKRRAI